jgi:K+-transporting ATPase ATPase C chain
MFSVIRPAIVMMVLFTLVFGLAYPLAITGVARLVLPAQSGGSLVRNGAGNIVGSSLIAQGFSRTEYLHSRPSAAGKGWDPLNSGGSNLGPMDSKLADRIAGDAAALRKENPGAVIPADAVTTSGSGLDPDISPENAHMQALRVAASRGLAPGVVDALIAQATIQPFLGFIGQPAVNVLAVNRALDARYPMAHHKG